MTTGNINELTNYGGFMPGHVAVYQAMMGSYEQPNASKYTPNKSEGSTYKRDQLGASSSTYRPTVQRKGSTYRPNALRNGAMNDYMKDFMKGLGIGMGAAYAKKMLGDQGAGCTCGNCPVHQGQASYKPGGLEKLFGTGSDYRQPYKNTKSGDKYGSGNSQSNAYKA